MAYLVGLADRANGYNLSLNAGLSTAEKGINYDSIIEYMSFEAAEDI